MKTSEGRRWTFPKGHVKPRERPELAAAREAMEEAGVTGNIDPEPLGRYTFPGGSGSNSEVRKPVTAYLLDVKEARLPQEKHRKPTWFGAEKAKKKLAERRRKTFAKEHARMIDAAVERLRRLRG